MCFDHSRRDAIVRNHVNESRKFPLRLENMCIEEQKVSCKKEEILNQLADWQYNNIAFCLIFIRKILPVCS